MYSSHLPQVHDTHKQGLVPYLLAVTLQKGASGYIGDGSNRWPLLGSTG
jgi:hypothetical protein